MNKTVSVNIGGRVFNIEESAFDKLNRYLQTIRSYFEGNESVDEIISDIELRVAELFMERINDQKQVITISDVDEVITVLGKPEDYIDEEDEVHTSTKRKTGKRVFRDPDNKILFGVCGGISAYFGWDPIVLRALFAIFTIFYGFGILIYIVLAIIIPKAKTTAEKLQMRGEPVTVDNISKKVSESFDNVQEDIKNFGERNKSSINSAGDRIGSFISDLFSVLGKVIRVILLVFVKILGFALLMAGLAGLVAAIAAAFGWHGFMAMHGSEFIGDPSISNILDSTFSSTVQKTLFYLGGILVYFIPVVAFILLGIRLLFDYKRIPGLVGVVLLILWFAGVGFLTAAGFNSAREFRVETSFTEDVPLELPTSDTLYLDIAQEGSTIYEFRNGFGNNEIYFPDGVTFPGIDSTNIIYMGDVEFTVKMNRRDSLYRLSVKREANGSSQKDAVMHAREAKTFASVKGDSLLIFPYFAMEKGALLRNQDVSYELSIPVGKSIHFNPRSEAIIYDVPNITNTHDRDMIGKTWYMTPKGLRCKGCPDIDRKMEKMELEEMMKEELERLEESREMMIEEIEEDLERLRDSMEDAKDDELREMREVVRELEKEQRRLQRELEREKRNLERDIERELRNFEEEFR